MQDENDIVSIQDTKENKNDDTLHKLIRQARRHKVKESRVNAKEVNLGEPELDIEWHAAPFLKKCYCPAEPCICQSHLLKAGYLPQRLHYINKDNSDKVPPHTLVPRLAAAVKAEIEISKQLRKKLEQRGPEFCASNCKAFLHPVKEGGYHAERKKLIERYIKDNNLEKKMKHYVKIREGKCLQQIQCRRKLAEKVACLREKLQKKATESCEVEDGEDDEIEEDYSCPPHVENLPQTPCKNEEMNEDMEYHRLSTGARSDAQISKRRTSPCACSNKEQTAITDEQSSSTNDACVVPTSGTYTKLAKETKDGDMPCVRTTDNCTSPQSDDGIIAHREVDCKELRSNRTYAGPIEGMNADKECDVNDYRGKAPTKDCETDPVDFDKDDCECKRRECRTDNRKRKHLTKLDTKGPIGRKYFSLI